MSPLVVPEQYLRPLVESLPFAMALFDREMRYLAMSPRWLADYGLRRETTLGRCHYEIFPEMTEAWKIIHRRGMGGEVISESRDRFVRADGKVQWLRWEVRPWYPEADRIGGILISTEEVSSVEALESAVRIRDEIIEIIAHDLKNPTQAILLSCSLLGKARPGDSARLNELASNIRESAEQMRSLISRLLDISRIESGNLRLDLAPADVGTILREQIGALRAQAEAKNLFIELDVAPEVAPVPCDRAAIGQVVANLLGNAISHTPSGQGIRVSARRAESGVEFTVADSGPGIPAESLGHIFDRYWQADQTRHLGSGLGLAIAHGIVMAHRGHIWAESNAGRGARFHFWIPGA